MNTNLIGVAIGLVSLLCLGRPYALLALILAASALEAAAAVSLSSYGLQPALVPTGALLVFFVLQYTQGMHFRGAGLVGNTLRPFIWVVGWALLSSVLLPRLFAGTVMIWPQRPEWPFLPVPLVPGSANLTQDFYIALDFLCLVMAALLSSREAADNDVVLLGWWVGGAIASGVALWQFASLHAPIPYPNELLHSNPNWAQLSTQELAGTNRINGSFSEPASLAAFLIQYVFAISWTMLRGYRLGSIALLLPLSVLCILLSTSSTGLVALALFAVFIAALAAVARSGAVRRRAGAVVVAAILLGGPVAVAGAIFFPGIVQVATGVAYATLNKGDSDSYRDRTNADADSLMLLVPSYGLGVGWGSNRSSSLIPGLLASLGVIGAAGLLIFALRIGRLARRCMTAGARDLDLFHMEAALAGAVGTITAGSISSPGITAVSFYVLLGLAVGSAARRLSRISRALAAP